MFNDNLNMSSCKAKLSTVCVCMKSSLFLLSNRSDNFSKEVALHFANHQFLSVHCIFYLCYMKNNTKILTGKLPLCICTLIGAFFYSGCELSDCRKRLAIAINCRQLKVTAINNPENHDIGQLSFLK